MQPFDPERTPIFHITHVDNIESIVSAGCIHCDASRRRGDFACVNIGHMHIKDRRMRRQVPKAAGGVLGDYVPFNFCPRSVMLYVIHKQGVSGFYGDHRSIIHLATTVGEACRSGRPWTFTDRHAELGYALYFDDLSELHRVNWDVMQLRYWSEKEISEQRQAEFLVHNHFPWTCVKWIAVHKPAIEKDAARILSLATHQPNILIRSSFYYS